MLSPITPTPVPSTSNDNAPDATSLVVAEIDSEQELAAAAERLRLVYQSQLVSDVPQRDVLFHCAVGLACTDDTTDLECAVGILESLLSQGYCASECRLHLARAYQRQGRIVKARRVLDLCLAHEPDFAEAREFYAEFDRQARVDGKIAIYGLLGIAAFVAIAVACVRQARSTSTTASRN